MNDLIELVFENPFLLILIVGGIISFLKGKSEKPEEETDIQSTNKPKQAENPFERSRQTEQRQPVEKPKAKPVSSLSIEELREEQMLRFSGQVESDEHQRIVDRPTVSAKDEKNVHDKAKNRNKKAFKNDFDQSLTKQGLINSVIMAEVLGSPRARRSYQTVITKRRNS
jgi:hypothetical protein